MTERVVESQETHFDASKTTINQYASSWNCRLMELMRELAFVVSGPVVLTHHPKDLLASLEERAKWGGQD